MRLIVRAVLACGALAAGTFAVVSACSPPDALELGQCGNSIVEGDAGEQCDNHPTEGGFSCFAADARTRACHIACGDGGTCPSGFGCGVDGVCRNPSTPPKLTFASSTQTDVRELALADFDGDGRLDVVTRGIGATNVWFFDGSGNVAGAAASISLPRGRVTTGKLPNGGGANLVAFDTSPVQLPTGIALIGTGLETWIGQSDRTLQPILFSSLPVPSQDAFVFGANVTGLHGGTDDMVTVTLTPGDPLDAGGLVALFQPDKTPPFFPEYVLAGTTNDAGVHGEIPVARVPPNLECDTIAIGIARGKTATVLPTCDDAGAASVLDAGTKPNVTFANNIDLGPLLFADWDHDGLVDLVAGGNVTGDASITGVIQVAFGNADGTFKPGAIQPTAPVSSPLYAVGDLDGDLALDWVDSAGVYSTRSQTHLLSTLTTRQARILDLNRDGFGDAIALSTAGIDVWIGSGGSLMNHRLYDLANASTFAIGDLDGDSNLDIIAAANQGDSDTLYVLWGSQGGFPAAPVAVGSVREARHLATGRVTWLFGDPPDNVSSTIVVGADETGKALSVIPIQGHTNRQLTSPFTVTPQLGDSGLPGQTVLPLNGAIGLVPFDGGLVPGVTMLASPPTAGDASSLLLQAWTAPATSASQTFDSKTLIVPPTGGFSLLATSALNAQGLGMTTIDLDPSANNGDELVAVLPSVIGGPQGSLGVAQLGGSGWTQVSQETFTGFVRAFSAANTLLPVRVTRADFDGDGIADLLLVYGTINGDASNDDDNDAEVRFGDGAGHLVDAVVVEHLQSAAPINALGDGRRQLMTATKDGLVFRALTTCGSGKMRCFDSGTKIFTGDFSRTIDLICGDVTGDGVDDVITADPANFHVYVANAAIP